MRSEVTVRGVMGKKTFFSAKQSAEIKRRRSRGQTFTLIAREMCAPYEALRRQFDEGFRLRRNERVRINRETVGARYGAGQSAELVRHVETPSFVLEERTRRLALSRPSLTAEFFGDPLPGYSALDRMQRS